MYNRRSVQTFSDYTPAFDALLSVTILAIITMGVMSVPPPDSYIQDVRIDIQTVQARQIAVPQTITNFPDMGVMYEIGKYGYGGSSPSYRADFRDDVVVVSEDFMTDNDKLDIDSDITDQYEFWVGFPEDYSPPDALASAPGSYGICWIEHPTCDPNSPVRYIVIKH